MGNIGIRPISEKFLQPNYLFALEFAEGFIFGRVIRRRLCRWWPWALINSAGTAVTVSANSYQTELRFRDPRNVEDDILYLEDSVSRGKWPWLYHGSIGVKPQQMRVYLRIPETQEIPGKFVKVDPITPSNNDDLGYINSLVSPYGNPTDYMEIVIPPKTHIGAEYYNEDPNYAHRPVLDLYFALYFFQILTPARNGILISKIAAREVPAAFLSVGVGDIPLTIGGLSKDWDITPITLDEALALGGK